jgi:Calcineurin-like phosphoesterase
MNDKEQDMLAVRTHKQRPEFGNPTHTGKEFPRFIQVPIPQPVNSTLPLSAVLGATGVSDIQKAGQIVFHAVGDTGGHNGTEVQEALAVAMEAQFRANANDNPAFFYHLGDVIYYNGQIEAYPTQFYEPYQFYPAVIFAIPGNHDGDTAVQPNDAPDTEPSLYGFTQNFCATQRTRLNAYRDTMTQPYVFWTLKAPFVTIIGLYGNVDGNLDGPGAAAQQQWFTDQLAQADPSTCIIVAVHQPPYSLDTTHCGYPYIGDAIDQAASAAKVWPDAVFSGHVHNYQRFTRHVELDDGKTKAIPYLIAGAGGYANKAQRLHKIQKDENGKPPGPLPFETTQPGVQLNAYNDENPGFLRVTVTAERLTAQYSTVSFEDQSVNQFDTVVLDHTNGRIIQ